MNTSISFSGVYGIHGQKSVVKAVCKQIKDENAGQDVPTAFWQECENRSYDHESQKESTVLVFTKKEDALEYKEAVKSLAEDNPNTLENEVIPHAWQKFIGGAGVYGRLDGFKFPRPSATKDLDKVYSADRVRDAIGIGQFNTVKGTAEAPKMPVMVLRG